MTKKDYLEFIFFMCCTFFTLIVYDLFWGINTGLSPYDNCIVGNINEFKGGRLIDYLSVYGLYFIVSELYKLGFITKGKSSHRRIRLDEDQISLINTVNFNREYPVKIVSN